MEGTSTEEFFKNIGLENERVDLNTFHKTVGEAIGLEEDNTNRLFMEIDKKREGSISLKEFMKIIDSYRTDMEVRPITEDSGVSHKIHILD